MPGMIDDENRPAVLLASPITLRPAQKVVLLVDDCTMTRECLSFTLSSKGGDAFELLCTASVREDEIATPALVLLNVHSATLNDRGVVEYTQQVQRTFPDAPIALIAAADDPAVMMEAVRRGYRAYITTNMNSELVIAAINVVLAGGIYVPTKMVTHCLEGAPSDTTGLTGKEQEVLTHLMDGKANKVIARDLSLSVHTVKLHVHNIMQKLGAVSRAQIIARVRGTQFTAVQQMEAVN